MIARLWKGYAAPEKAGDYLHHLQTNVMPELKTIAGYRGISVLQREIADGIEFTVITQWDSMDAIRQFAGETLEQAVVEPEARAALYAFDEHVTHYEIVIKENGK